MDNDLDFPAIRDYVIEVSLEAGSAVASAAMRETHIAIKKNTADLVTETDRHVEALIRSRLSQRYPLFHFIGEESHGEEPAARITTSPTFVVDPVDGTSNFVHGVPAVCVSIALVVDRRPAVGVVYNPFTSELWAGARGCGAYVREHRGETHALPVVKSALEGLETASVGIEFGSDRQGPNFDLNLHVFTSLLRAHADGGQFVNSLRAVGSAAIAICRVAAGQQDAFWECGCWAWDVAAAWCILEEAGGITVDGHPDCWTPDIDGRRYLAVRPAERGQMSFVKAFWKVLGEYRWTP